jgi:hypothetical protein
MKRFLQKKWFRRLVQTLAVALSLMAVAYAATNWWGARMKRDAIAEWQAAGRPLTLAGMLEPLPPDAKNFAMLPIFMEVTREYAGQVDMGRPREGTLGYRMAEMGRMGDTYFKSERNKTPDFSEWARLNGIENQSALILQKFDEKNSEILAQLREGLSRPFTEPPRWHRIASDPNALFEPGMPIHTLAFINAGLVLRGEVAIAANRPEIALESVAMGLRVADLLAAENTFGGALLQVASWSRLEIVMARALDQGIWTEQELIKLRALIARTNESHLVRPILDLETLAMIGRFTHYRHDREKIAAYFGAYSAFAFTMAKKPVLRELVPAGWYDAFLARCIRMNLEQIDVHARADKSLLEWCRASAAVDASHGGRGSLSQALMPDKDMGVHPRTLRERISYATVRRAQALLACDLAIFRKKNGKYPATLEELGGEAATIDPMTNQPFHYRAADDGFVLYSSGIDGTDNVGDRGGERSQYWGAPDWVW